MFRTAQLGIKRPGYWAQNRPPFAPNQSSRLFFRPRSIFLREQFCFIQSFPRTCDQKILCCTYQIFLHSYKGFDRGAWLWSPPWWLWCTSILPSRYWEQWETIWIVFFKARNCCCFDLLLDHANQPRIVLPSWVLVQEKLDGYKNLPVESKTKVIQRTGPSWRHRENHPSSRQHWPSFPQHFRTASPGQRWHHQGLWLPWGGWHVRAENEGGIRYHSFWFRVFLENLKSSRTEYLAFRT